MGTEKVHFSVAEESDLFGYTLSVYCILLPILCLNLYLFKILVMARLYNVDFKE